MRRSPLATASKAELLSLLEWIIGRRLDGDSYRRDLERHLSRLRFDAIQAEILELIGECKRLAVDREKLCVGERVLSLAASAAIHERIAALNRRLDVLMELKK